MWAFIHVLYLIGWGNRIGTLYTWARALTFSHRAHRIITFEQAHDHAGHPALRRSGNGGPPAVAASSTPSLAPGASAQPDGGRDVDLAGQEARTTARP
jgi:NADH dehydrogenase